MFRHLVIPLLGVAHAGEARAFPFMGPPGDPDTESTILQLVEVGVPDLRVEMDAAFDDAALLLSWPIPLTLSAGHLHPKNYIFLLLEPQYQTQSEMFRGAVLLRIDYGPLIFNDHALMTRYGLGAVHIEGGGVIGEDGNGWTAGAGSSMGWYRPMRALTIGYRFTRTRFEDGPWINRHDFVIDLLMFPFLLAPQEDWSFLRE